jgi:beta-lactam-binding protein with PASTA domain
VPAVIGLGAQEARERLAAAGFEVGVRYREGTEGGNGKVLEQSVAGGKEADEGRRSSSRSEKARERWKLRIWSASPTPRPRTS